MNHKLLSSDYTNVIKNVVNIVSSMNNCIFLIDLCEESFMIWSLF